MARSTPSAKPRQPPPAEGREPAQMGVRQAAVWAMAGQYVGFVIQFITSVIISRYFLSPAEVGLFSIALSAAMLVAMVQDFGLARYISGLPSIDLAERQRCSTVAFAFSLLLAGLIMASAYPLAAFYHQPRLAPIVLVIGASYLVLPFAIVPTAMLARRMAFRSHFIINTGAGLAQCIVGLTLAWMGYSSLALAWGTFGANVARGVLAQCLSPAPPWPLRADGLKPVMHSGSKMTTLYVSGALAGRVPDMIVGKLLSLIAVGLYSRAMSLSDQFRTLISGAIGGVFFPAFARIRDQGEPMGPAYLRVVAGYTAVIWPGMAGLSLATTPIVHLLYGPRWMGVAPLLSIISLGEIFMVALPLHTEMPILLGRINRLLVFNFVDSGMSVVLLAAGCGWGVTGAAGSRLVYGVLWVALYARFLRGLIGFDVRALLTIYLKSALAAAAALAPLGGVYLFWMGPQVIALPVLMASVGLGGVLWLAALWLLRHPACEDMLGVAGHILAPLRRRLTAAPARVSTPSG